MGKMPVLACTGMMVASLLLAGCKCCGKGGCGSCLFGNSCETCEEGPTFSSLPAGNYASPNAQQVNYAQKAPNAQAHIQAAQAGWNNSQTKIIRDTQKIRNAAGNVVAGPQSSVNPNIIQAGYQQQPQTQPQPPQPPQPRTGTTTNQTQYHVPSHQPVVQPSPAYIPGSNGSTGPNLR